MSRGKRGSRGDPIVQAMELALRLGDFIGYGASWEFVSGLEEVERDIAELLSAKPERAVDLYETFVAGCYEKAEEIDDSSGSFGIFVQDLFRGWIRARQSAGSDAEETARMLLRWMDNDDYGFCYQLEREAVKALNKKGLSVFASQLQTRFDAGARTKGAEDGRENGYRRHYKGEALKTVYAAQRNAESYVAVCEETELVPSDCEILAGIFQSRRKPDQALAWVERGLELQKKAAGGRGASYQLADMRRKLLTKLGRSSEALSSAWSEFEQYPSRLAYDQLMKYVPKGQRAAWHDKAINASAQAGLHSVIELWLATKETQRLAERLRAASHEELESLSHYTTEPAARKLSRSHPDIAAKVYRALGMRILNAKKSKYYGAALSNFEQAKRCYRKAGLDSAWDELAAEIRLNHGRKRSFIPGFERLLQGKKPDATPSFHDRTERGKGSWVRNGGSGNDGSDEDL